VDDKLLTTAELADELKIPVETIYQWRLRREGPRAIKVGRHLRFRRADIDAWIERQADPSPAA
jgi:excisionase family DNA binding protein